VTALRLGVDADPVGRDGSGNETYLRGILGGLSRQLGPEETVIVAGRNGDALREAFGSWAEVVPLPSGLRGELALGRGLQSRHASVAVGHYTAPFGFTGPRMTVVHDVAFLRIPDLLPSALRWRMRATVGLSIRRSDLVVTVSEFSRRELRSCYPFLSDDAIVVTPDAVDAAYFVRPTAEHADHLRDRYELPARFILAVGNLQPRKNLARLVEATTRLGAPLVIVGRAHWGVASAAPETATVRYLGYVPLEDLVGLYGLCAVFAYPSLYEGFGLPALEAMAAGAPVVASDRGAIPEVVADAAVLIDPTDVDAIAAGLAAVLEDDALATSLRTRGRARASFYSWDESAKVLLERARSLHRASGAC
jgi:glycosyltransferase involved in cell wall biosynthesis